jgi:hypothetical protein
MDQNQAVSPRSSFSPQRESFLEGLPLASACPECSPAREGLEQYISSIFLAAYNARTLEYLPLLFSLESDDAYTAALGLRSAAISPLFCEQYLDSTVEDEVASLYAAQADRRSIMELGNLVASSPGQSVLLYLLATVALHQAGIKYLLFAANKAVRASIRRSGFTPKIIRVAEKNRLGAQAKHWGTYYEGEPIVMLADISLTMDQIMAQPEMRRIMGCYRHTIPVLADAIEKHIT